MNKTIIVLICLGFITTGIIPAMAMNIEQNSNYVKDCEEQLDLESSDNTSYFIETGGAVQRPPFSAAFVEITDGPELQVLKINRFLFNRFFHPIIPIIPVEGLDFKIYYLVEEIGPFSRWEYSTVYAPIGTPGIDWTEATWISNFYFKRAKLFNPGHFQLGWPARYMFVGNCDNVTVSFDV